MKFTLAATAPRRSSKSNPAESLAADYVQRASRYLSVEVQTFPSEAVLFEAIEKLDKQTRTPTHLILLDSRGKLLSSGDFAAHLGRLRDTGTQRVLLAMAPPTAGAKPPASAPISSFHLAP